MKIEEKLPYAAKAIDFIATHDDAPIEVVDNALSAVEAHLKEARRAVRQRRKLPTKAWWQFWRK